ncbi:hypothetical protein SynWH8103_00521 [Synechococcus sp. WH 8103]|nr:hypothetical protein SynWH8103_00521 [Synechococcus sp. WH 8103]
MKEKKVHDISEVQDRSFGQILHCFQTLLASLERFLTMDATPPLTAETNDASLGTLTRACHEGMNQNQAKPIFLII